MKKRLVVIDADTIALRNATYCQTNHDFYSVPGDELIGSYTSLKHFFEKEGKDLSQEEYRRVDIVKPAKPRGLGGPEVIGYHGCKQEIEKIINLEWVDDYEIVIHGTGNFRDEVATIKPYKGERKDKPLYTQHMKDYLKKRYGDKCIIINGEESDDYVARKGWQAWMRCEDKEKYSDIDTVLAYIDKDIAQVPGISYNYDTKEVKIISIMDAAYSFWSQCLTGDTTDNIPGVPKISKELKTKYKLRTSSGIGAKSAKTLLEGCESPKEMAEVVVEVYQDACGEGWLERLDEVGKLLFMCQQEGVLWDAKATLDRMEIDYENINIPQPEQEDS